MRPPLEVIIAIAHAVEKAGGDMDDVRDLVDTWERLAVTTGPRADACAVRQRPSGAVARTNPRRPRTVVVHAATAGRR